MREASDARLTSPFSNGRKPDIIADYNGETMMMTDTSKTRQVVMDLIKQNIAKLGLNETLHLLLEIEGDVQDLRNKFRENARKIA
jgi:hypothetical protein